MWHKFLCQMSCRNWAEISSQTSTLIFLFSYPAGNEMRENFQFWQVAGILTDALISFQKLLKNNFLRLHFYDMHIIQKQHTVQNCILKKAILESSFEQKSERWPRKIVVWKRFCQSHNIEKSSETRNKQLLFVFTSSSSHPDSCQKPWCFSLKAPHFSH